MGPKKFHVTETELDVLQVLWERGATSTRDICEALYPGGGTSHYYTVQKLLERLESRGCVDRDRSNRVHRFTAAVDRAVLLEERLRELSESLCDGSVLPLLTGLCRIGRWTVAEQKQLNQLLAKLNADNHAKPKKA